MTSPAIEINEFSKRYGDFVAVDNITFAIHPGEIFGLLGPNGAGKTTTLECLEGLRTPSDGSLTVAGINPAKSPRRLRDVIGVQLQTSGLPETITPDEAMRFFCAYHGVEARLDIIERLGLAEKRGAQFHELSTGQQRRLALALAVAHKPSVLFLDEPTAGLDVATRVDLHNIMREMQRDGTTILLATHDMSEAEEMSDRVAIMLRGRIASVGTPMEITAEGAEFTKVSVRTRDGGVSSPEAEFPAVEKSVAEGEYTIFFSKDIGPTVAEIIAYIEKTGDALIDLRVERPSLEDRFLEITGADDSGSEDRS